MKKYLYLVIPSVLIISFLTGCASLGPRYTDVQSKGVLTPPRDQGLVIFYCLEGGMPTIYNADDNNKLLATMPPKTFDYAFFKPGPLHLLCGKKVNGGAIAAETILGGPLYLLQLGGQGLKPYGPINIAAGQSYYLRAHVGWSGWLEEVPESTAEENLQHCEYYHANSR